MGKQPSLTHYERYNLVSGHVTLSEKTGAPIVYGPNANTQFESIIAIDNQVFQIGKISIKVLHTPGHTMESTTYLLRDENGKDQAIFSGDTLFLGDVGRPDLAQKSESITKEDLAGFLFDSLRKKIMPLADEVTVYPAHGAGSLRADMTKAEFITEVTEGLLPPPTYFALNAALNKKGYESIDTVLERGMIALTPEKFEEIANQEEALILDVRHQSHFAKEHIPGSIFIGLNGSFAPWVGALITDIQQNILLVTPEGKEEETVTRLARVGYDNTLGYLAGGIAAWQKVGKETDFVKSISPMAFAKSLQTDTDRKVIDVRKPTEYLAHQVIGATNFPLDYINKNMDKIDRTTPYFVHCAGGYRSMIATSILKARGVHDLVDVQDGFKGIESTGAITLSNYQCPTTISQEEIDALM